MKTNIAFLIIATFLTQLIMAQETKVKTKEDFKVEIRELDDIHMVYYEYKGSYHKAFDDFGKLMEYIQKEQLPVGAHALAVYYDDPNIVAEEKLRSEPGYMVQGPVEVSDGFKYKKISGAKAVCSHYNSMEEIVLAYEAIGEYIAKENLQTQEFALEIYYNLEPETYDGEILFLIK